MQISNQEKIGPPGPKKPFNNKFLTIPAGVILLAGLVFAFNGFDANKYFSSLFSAGGKGSPAKKQERGMSFVGLAEIKKIDSENKILTVYFRAGSNSMKDIRFQEATLPIDDSAEIFVNQVKTEFGDLIVGDEGFVSGKKKFKSILNVERIEIER